VGFEPSSAMTEGNRGERAMAMSREVAPQPDSGMTWESVLTAPARGQHIAQLHTSKDFLARAVGEFVVAGLREGEAILLVATPGHREAILRRVEGSGFRVPDLSRRGQLTVLNAVETLAELLVDGVPDRTRFQAVIGQAVDAGLSRGYPRLRAFGEMVELLRHPSVSAALKLEELWNELVSARRIALLCGYSIDAFDPHVYHGLLQRVSDAHSHLVPIEDYARLERAVTEAYLEVFGAGRDSGFLRRTFLAHYPRPAVMPDAQASILAAQEFVPEASAALLERVRHHYQSAAPAA
jgi:MEDS: MEthanogen/methylotroph, DcmR Sensory domain